MNNAQTEEKPLFHIERNPLLLFSAVGISAVLGISTWWLFKTVSPFGFFIMIPAVVVLIQTAWLIMNPFATVYERRLEIKQTLFNPKERFFNDLDKVNQNDKGQIFITYTDGEVEKLNLFGIRPSHKAALVEYCDKQITHTLSTRG